jgi:hypothetical protein
MPSQRVERLTMSDNRAPLASGRAAHADDGGEAHSMGRRALMTDGISALPNVRRKGRPACGTSP